MESLVSDIPAKDRTIANLFLQCRGAILTYICTNPVFYKVQYNMAEDNDFKYQCIDQDNLVKLP
jgi:hypothetical protein